MLADILILFNAVLPSKAHSDRKRPLKEIFPLRQEARGMLSALPPKFLK
jgi:hypothetical protein